MRKFVGIKRVTNEVLDDDVAIFDTFVLCREEVISRFEGRAQFHITRVETQPDITEWVKAMIALGENPRAIVDQIAAEVQNAGIVEPYLDGIFTLLD